jgi:hypothetical protein
MNTSLLLGLGLGLLAGIVAALRIIAPMTKNTIDDKVLDVAEGVEKLVPPPK